jgi:phosphonate C-P lyase system protein PhnH
MDHEVTFALSDGWDDALHRELAQRTGAHSTNWEQADFVFIAGGTSAGRAATAKRGSLAYPDEGATLVYCVPALTEAGTEEKAHQRTRLSGPGIEHPGSPGLAGLSMAEYDLLQAVNADYPIGVDAFVVQGNQYIMGLPRSTYIEVK